MRNSLITIFSVLILDQLVKLWIKSSYVLSTGNSVISEWWIVKIQFIENPGMAFGWTLGDEGAIWGKIILSSFRIIAVIFIGLYIRRLIRTQAHPFFIICISLVFAGALGNIIDSAFYGILFSESTFNEMAVFLPENGGYAPFMMGHVVDMIHLDFNWPSWMPFGLSGNEVFPPIFNVADSAISVSVFLIIIFYKRIVRDEDFQFFNKKSSEA